MTSAFFTFVSALYIKPYNPTVTLCTPIATTRFNFKKFFILSTMCFVWFSEQTSYLYKINFLVFVTEKKGLLYKLIFFYLIWINFCL
jgi:hypothetical protein